VPLQQLEGDGLEARPTLSMELAIFFAGVMVGVVFTLSLAVIWGLFAPWVRCFLCGAPLSLFNLLGMRLRGSPVGLLIDTHIGLIQGPVMHNEEYMTFKMNEIEAKYLANRHKVHTMQDLTSLLVDDWKGRHPVK
jgi:hypothetical protein